MSPTLISLTNRVQMTFTLGILTIWILVALCFVAISMVDDLGYFDYILSYSILIYLACRLIVVFQNHTRDGSFAYYVVTAHSQSRRQALATLIFSCGWIIAIATRMFMMFLMTIVSSGLITIHRYGGLEAFMHELYQEESDDPAYVERMRKDWEDAARAMDEFHDDLSYDPVKLVGWMSPKLMIFCLVFAWTSISTLALYVVRLSWRSLKRVCRLPTEVKSTAKKESLA